MGTTHGYSGTPLAKKLGIKAGSAVFAINPPDNYAELLAPLPDGVTFVDAEDSADVIHVFCDRRIALEQAVQSLRHTMAKNAALWVSWPKKASKVPTDFTEDTIRKVALPTGLVDVKVCAVDATWSGLKLVIRKELR